MLNGLFAPAFVVGIKCGVIHACHFYEALIQMCLLRHVYSRFIKMIASSPQALKIIFSAIVHMIKFLEEFC